MMCGKIPNLVAPMRAPDAAGVGSRGVPRRKVGSDSRLSLNPERDPFDNQISFAYELLRALA